MHQLTNPIVLGKIGSTYGIYGWIKLFSYTEKITNIFNYQPWFIKKNQEWEKIELDKWKFYKKRLIFKVKKNKNNKKLISLTNLDIFIDKSQLPCTNKNEYYFQDLIYCKVINLTGYHLGIVINLINFGINTIIIIRSNISNKYKFQEIMVPCVFGEIIKFIDIKKKLIKVDWDIDF